MVVFVRDFLSKKKGRSLVVCFDVREQKSKERKKKREIPAAKNSLSFHARAFLCFKKLLRFITRAEAAHIYAHINE